MKTKIYVGVDFGGTKILTGAMTSDGEIRGEPVKAPTISSDDPRMIIKRVTDSIDAIRRSIDENIYEIAGIGLGVTGPLDCTNGIILDCPNLPTLHQFPLRKTIEAYASLPVFMNNDANCLIYGETLFGSGAGRNTVVGFTLGTGLGCAIIVNKKIVMGSTESAGEIWTSPYKDGIIEEYVSGAGVTRAYTSACGVELSAQEIAHRAEAGDVNALKTWEEFGVHLSAAMAWTINIVDPDLVILGGSIANAYDFFAASMETHLRKFICTVPAASTKIVTARLGANAGFIGAASLAL